MAKFKRAFLVFFVGGLIFPAQVEKVRADQAISVLDGLKRISSTDIFPLPFTVSELSQISGINPFISGPHGAGFDRYNTTAFGHYNPKFIEWAKHATVPTEFGYYRTTKTIFENYLANHVVGLMQAYRFLNSNPGINKKYLDEYKEHVSNGRNYSPYGVIGYDNRHDPTHVAYWLRRQLDGTAAGVMELLEILISVYGRPSSGAFADFPVSPEYALTQLGQYHGHEVRFEDRDDVFVLTVDGQGQSVLNKEKIRIAMVHDAVTDKGDEKSGKMVFLGSEYSEPLWIVKGPSFKPGPLKSAAITDLKQCEKKGCSFEIGQKKYILKIPSYEDVIVEPGVPPTRKYFVEINDGREKQFLSGIRRIVWMGDLDRDGELDLIFEDGFHYNIMTSLKLLLSGPAKYTLFREVTDFRAGGC